LSAIICGFTLPVAAQQGNEVARVFEMVDAYRQSHETEIFEEFVEFLALPNIADNPDDMDRNAVHVTALFESRGFAVRRLEAGGSPYIFAALGDDPDAATVMFYAHYDGQPVLEADWAFPPFSPALLDGPIDRGGRPVEAQALERGFDPQWRLYARSAGDDKMPIIALLFAIDALTANDVTPSINIKVLLDGEEEQGSPTLAAMLDRYGSLLDADLMLFCDGPMHQSRRPQLMFGVRGDMGVDVTAYGASRPLHSGHYGNWAPNPIMQLAYLLTSMRDESGRILIEDYYADVVSLSESERRAIEAMPDVTVALMQELAVHTPEGEGRRIEELISLPAVNARGFVAGGVGDDASNIVLAQATVALDLRLVPNQTPESVRARVERHIQSQGFHIIYDEPSLETLRSHPKVARLEWRSGYPALRTRMDEPAATRLIALMRAIAPDLILTPTMGGSLPLYRFAERLSAPIVILPLANHDNNQHAENENIRVQNIWDAIPVFGTILAGYGR
jgi:acetylornithine deacetylase/succinyl-diaminopimelate desuccinylase-like protein